MFVPALNRKAAMFAAACLVFSSAPLRADDACIEAQRMIRQGVDLSDGSVQEEGLYRQAIEKCPKLPEGHFNLGLVELKRGNPKNAEDLFEKALSSERRTPFLLALAETKVGQGDYEKARQLYDEVLQKESGNVKALQGISVVFEKLQRFDKAAESLQKALAIEPSNALTHYNLAVIHERQGALEAAEAAYKKSLELDKENFSANFFLGLLYKKLERYEPAIERLTKAANLQPENAEVYKALGVINEKRGDFDKAELAFKKAADLDAADISSKINLAVVMIRKRREAPAEELLLEAAKTSPDNPHLLSVLGWAQLELGKYEQARESLDRSLQLDAMNAAARNNLGVVYERLGRRDEAKREFQAAQELDPGLRAKSSN